VLTTPCSSDTPPPSAEPMLFRGGVDDGDIKLNNAVAEAHRGERQLLCQSGWRFRRAGHRATFVEFGRKSQ
jgi:hypothetical protein